MSRTILAVWAAAVVMATLGVVGAVVIVTGSKENSQFPAFSDKGISSSFSDDLCRTFRQEFPQTAAEAAKRFGVAEDQVELKKGTCTPSSTTVVNRVTLKIDKPVNLTASRFEKVTAKKDADSPEVGLESGRCIVAKYIEVRIYPNANTGGDVDVVVNGNANSNEPIYQP